MTTELFEAIGEILLSKTHKLFSSIWNNEVLPQKWNECSTVPIHRKLDKTVCTNYRGVSFLSTSDKVISSILLSRLTPYVAEIFGDHQCEFRRQKSTIDYVLEKKIGVR
jgi:hypothetical protein